MVSNAVGDQRQIMYGDAYSLLKAAILNGRLNDIIFYLYVSQLAVRYIIVRGCYDLISLFIRSQERSQL